MAACTPEGEHWARRIAATQENDRQVIQPKNEDRLADCPIAFQRKRIAQPPCTPFERVPNFQENIDFNQGG